MYGKRERERERVCKGVREGVLRISYLAAMATHNKYQETKDRGMGT